MKKSDVAFSNYKKYMACSGSLTETNDVNIISKGQVIQIDIGHRPNVRRTTCDLAAAPAPHLLVGEGRASEKTSPSRIDEKQSKFETEKYSRIHQNSVTARYVRCQVHNIQTTRERQVRYQDHLTCRISNPVRINSAYPQRPRIVASPVQVKKG